jgi:hypothetical protein
VLPTSPSPALSRRGPSLSPLKGGEGLFLERQPGDGGISIEQAAVLQPLWFPRQPCFARDTCYVAIFAAKSQAILRGRMDHSAFFPAVSLPKPPAGKIFSLLLPC